MTLIRSKMFLYTVYTNFERTNLQKKIFCHFGDLPHRQHPSMHYFDNTAQNVKSKFYNMNIGEK